MKNKVFYILGLLCAMSFASCNPEAPWTTDDVTIRMEVTTVSAGFVECSFSTDKNAYYLIAIEEAREGEDPMSVQKQFMTLALDSANREYIDWRNKLLKAGEFNIAPFSSHALHYGSVEHFFTGLGPGCTYWIYAFVVNPSTMKPCGKLHLVEVKTKDDSDIDVHFAYRVKGRWDYIYPLDSLGNIYMRFPYLATTMDSASLSEESTDPIWYFANWMIERFAEPSLANIMYGVYAMDNDGSNSALEFEVGHTYYTAICGYDGSFKQTTIYKFHWVGEETELYFVDTDPANIVNQLDE